MAKASFIKKRREAEIQAKSLKVEQELAKAQARVRALDKENKVDKSKAVVLSGIEREKMWLRKSCTKICHQVIQKSTMVSKPVTRFKKFFIAKKPLSREIILLGVPVMLEILAL